MGAEAQTAIVAMEGPLAAPPPWAVQQAIDAAGLSPCQKRKVGIAVYACDYRMQDGREYVRQTNAVGHNGPPWYPAWSARDVIDGPVVTPYTKPLCDGSPDCRRDCAKRCVHAEARAIDLIYPDLFLFQRAGLLRLVHVKLGRHGEVTACDGPSCIECSKMILDRGIGGIWLFERNKPGAGEAWEAWYKGSVLPDPIPPRWIYYPAAEFHEATCLRLGIHQVKS